jgi:hypothetical protein
MGQGVVVLTDGCPYFINTGDPEAAQMMRLDEEQACVSARSVAPYQGGVLYASPDGLVLVAQSGVNVVTEKIFDNKSWRALGPETIFAVKHDSRYYGFWTTGGFVLDVDGSFTTHDITASAAYVDPVLDQLYVAVGTKIQKWDAGTAKAHVWKSKRMNLAAPVNFACAQIKSNSFANLTFRVTTTLDSADQAASAASASNGLLVANGATVTHTRAVTSPEPFRLPSGFRSRLYEFAVSGTAHWTAFAVASSIKELKREF